MIFSLFFAVFRPSKSTVFPLISQIYIKAVKIHHCFSSKKYYPILTTFIALKTFCDKNNSLKLSTVFDNQTVFKTYIPNGKKTHPKIQARLRIGFKPQFYKFIYRLNLYPICRFNLYPFINHLYTFINSFIYPYYKFVYTFINKTVYIVIAF